MVIEILYSEVANLFGDRGNYWLLKKNLPDCQFILTSINDKPYFVDNEVNMIYLGPTDEKMQLMIIERLRPYQKKLSQLIDEGTFFLFTGNAYEILGKQIVDKKGKTTEGLNIFDIIAQRDMLNRQNSLFMGTYEQLQIVGFQSQFDFFTGQVPPLFKVEYGFGQNIKGLGEGIRVNNFFATTLLGPLLVLNPWFAKEYLRLLGCEIDELKYEKEMIEAYNLRVEDFKHVIKKEH
ncbi:MAG: hypothetical protein Q4C64_00860 [Erysipelotrichia bacterium]|nr:hypothetical protein [Erysipelotrichia bacterium]